MGFKNFFYISSAVGMLFVTACEMDAADRCTDQYEWNAEQAACILPVDTDVIDTVPPDTSPVQDGLGDPCYKDEECTDSANNYCLLDPTNPDAEGMCTFSNCTYDDCGGDFECCDCTSFTILKWDKPYCVDAASADALVSYCSCK